MASLKKHLPDLIAQKAAEKAGKATEKLVPKQPSTKPSTKPSVKPPAKPLIKPSIEPPVALDSDLSLLNSDADTAGLDEIKADTEDDLQSAVDYDALFPTVTPTERTPHPSDPPKSKLPTTKRKMKPLHQVGDQDPANQAHAAEAPQPPAKKPRLQDCAKSKPPAQSKPFSHTPTVPPLGLAAAPTPAAATTPVKPDKVESVPHTPTMPPTIPAVAPNPATVNHSQTIHDAPAGTVSPAHLHIHHDPMNTNTIYPGDKTRRRSL